jgi:hypothetical protein
MLVDGEYPKPFSAKIPYDPERFPKNKKVGKLVRELSRLRYGRDRQLVEDEINKRANLTTDSDDMSSKKGKGFKTPLKAAEDDDEDDSASTSSSDQTKKPGTAGAGKKSGSDSSGKSAGSPNLPSSFSAGLQ